MAKKKKKKKTISSVIKSAVKKATGNTKKTTTKKTTQKKPTVKASAYEQLNRKNNQAQQKRLQATQKKTNQQKTNQTKTNQQKKTQRGNVVLGSYEQLNRKNNQAQQKRMQAQKKAADERKKQNAKKDTTPQTTDWERLNRQNNQRNQQNAQKRKQESDKRREQRREDAKQAIEKSKKVNALGSEVKTRKSDTTNYSGMAREQAAVRVQAVAGINDTYSSADKVYEASKDSNGNYTISRADAERISANWQNMSKSERNKYIKDNYSDYIKSLDEEVKNKYDQRISSQDLTSDEYLRMQTASRLGKEMGTKSLKGQGLDKKVGARTALTYANSRAAMGFLEGSSFSPIQLDKGSVGTYTNSQKNAIEGAKQSGAYKAGYIGGIIASGLATNVAGGANRAVGAGLIKAAGRKGVETAGKTAVKAGTKATGTGAVKRFAADRAADTILSAPMNVTDSIKQATDAEGNIDAGNALKAMGLNTLGDMVLGGGIDLIGKGANKIVTKRNYGKIVNLMAKQKEGIPLSESEVDFLNKATKEAQDNMIKRAEREAVERVRANNPTADVATDAASTQTARAANNVEAQTTGANAPTARTDTPQADVPTARGAETPNARTAENAPVEATGNVARDVETPTARTDATGTPTARTAETPQTETPTARANEAPQAETPTARTDTPQTETPQARTDATQTTSTQSGNATKADSFKTDSDETIKKRAEGDWTNEEISQHATKLKERITNSLDDDGKFKVEFSDAKQRGLFGKNELTPQKEATAKAQAAYAKDPKRVVDNILDIETTPKGVKGDIHEVEAQINTALEDVIDKINKGIDEEANIKLAMQLMEKATEIASSAGQALNAAKMVLKETPEGRVRLAQKEVKRLNKKFADRLDESLKLTDDQIERIIKAADDEIDDVLGEIEVEIWNMIPATPFEKFNEIRHCSMLFNVKTHARNVIGNAIFKVARSGAEFIERQLTKAAKDRIKKLDGSLEMAEKVTKQEIKENRAAIDEYFETAYKQSDSRHMLNETVRPDGSRIFKSKALDKVTKLNYSALEWEDVKLAFRPEFRRSFIRYCKGHNLDFTDISKINQADLEKATKWAMSKAETATFRDACALSDTLTGLKTATAGKKGKTALGTAGYRVANMILESQLPFVKTPINIFRRAVDYSPLSVLRATAELATAKDAKTLMAGIHHLSTGLTGTGVSVLGFFLASQDMITLKAGNVSGDEYYDRDMGYQDYSLVLNIGGKEYSFTIDWASPMQTSLFLGAEMYDLLDEGITLDDALKGVSALTNPMLDMSFMSSMKETVDNFMEDVYNRGDDETNWSGALLNLLGGSIPQGYLNSLVPQLVSQGAQALDSKQRDTRSTAEGDLAKSWDSWTKRMINKVPVLRNYVLNPKLDRFGNDKETGNNIVLRLFNAFANPSNMKEIKYTKTDKELIKIYNHLPEDSNDKKFFFYNFTGNPSYDLANGKRMTYDEAYKYGKANRIEQTKMVENMIGAASYKDMTWSMKAKEVNDAHWISTNVADYKTYGYKYAAKNIISGEHAADADKEAYQMNKAAVGTAKDFVQFYVMKEKIVARSHGTDYYTKALAAAQFEKTHPNVKTNMAYAYNIYENKLNTAREYLKNGGSVKEYTNAMCRVMSGINRADVSNSGKNRAVSAANYKINTRTYNAMGISSADANMGYGLSKMYGYDLNSLALMKADAKMQFDLDMNGSLKKDEIVAYIESLGIEDATEKACIYRYFSTSKTNPYGSIPDWLGQGATDKSGSSSSGRSRRRSSGGSGSSSSGMSWEQWLKEMGLDTSSSSRSTRVSDNTSSSSLNDAYRKRQLKLLQATSGRRDS